MSPFLGRGQRELTGRKSSQSVSNQSKAKQMIELGLRPAKPPTKHAE